jgi:hypothetical protein
VLTLDGAPTVTDETCPACGRRYKRSTGFVLRDGVASAIYFAACHSHGDGGEVWLDIVTGSWEEPDFPGHATVSCRVSADGAGVVDALVASEGKADFFGARLSRQEALAHPAIDEVWEIVDFVVTADETVVAAVYGE